MAIVSEPAADAMVVVANMVSRVDAMVARSVLENAGVIVHISGEYHTAAEPISVALGGYRLFVPYWHLAEASLALREAGMPEHDVAYEGGKLAVLRFWLAVMGAHFFLAVPAFIAGFHPLLSLGMILLQPLGIPVDPRGRAEFFLVEEGS